MILLEDVVKVYASGGRRVTALGGISLHVERGEFLVVRGPSGSGKTTLLMTIGAMLHPSAGSIRIDGQDLNPMSARRRALFRARTIGFVFQMFHLVPYLNVADNVALAEVHGGNGEARTRVRQLLEQLGIEGRALHKPSELSAGERQRTAIARALMNNPKVLLADEPTGNLDAENARVVLGHLSDFHHKGGTVVLATHQLEAHSLASRVVNLREGQLV